MLHRTFQRKHYLGLLALLALMLFGFGLGSVVTAANDGEGSEWTGIEQTDEVFVVPLLIEHLQKRTATGSAGGFLGDKVSVASDIAVVGAHGDDNERGTDAGAAYIFGRSRGGTNNWGQITKVLASDGEANDQFGKAVFISLGVTVTVGAPGDDDKGEGAGSAYVYLRDPSNGNLWPEAAKLTAVDGAEGDAFGTAVSGHQKIVVVGAPGDGDNGESSGSVYIFERDSAAPPQWVQSKKIVAPNGAAGDNFGAAVLVSYGGDLVVIGAPGADDACPGDTECDSGAIYLFERNNGGPNQWGLRSKRLASDSAAGDLFGSALAMNYSQNRLIVGAPGDDDKGSNSGSAYIYERSLETGGTSWTEVAKLTAADGSANSRFGESFGIGGNIAIVGAPFAMHAGGSPGAAYLFFRHASSRQRWTEVAKLVASDGGSGYQFGSSVDLQSGDIVVGAPLNPTAGTDAGAAYFYQTPFDIGTLQVATNIEPDAPNSNWEISASGPLVFGETLTGDNVTDPVPVFAGDYTVTQSPGANTDGGLYDTSWSCLIDGSIGPFGSGTTLQVPINIRQNVVCTFLSMRPGSIIIEKQTQPDGGAGFSFTDTIEAPHNFTLDDDGTRTFLDVAPGTYQVSENEDADWRLTAITCIDPDNGSSISGATATIDLDAGESIRCTFVNRSKGGLTVTKSAGVSVAGVGQTITYTYRIFNDSPDTLTDLVAIDDKLGPVPLQTTTLAAGEEISGTLAHTVAADDLPGPLTNTVVVTGTPSTGPQLTDSAIASVNLVGLPQIEVNVTASASVAGVDDLITYVYEVTNTGPTNLNDIVAVDSRLGSVPLIDTTLEVGSSTNGTLIHRVQVGNLPGPLVNTVTATGTAPSGSQASATDSVTVDLSAEAAIGITLTATPGSATIGEVITYTYEIVNEGQIPLNDVSVTDDRLGDVPMGSANLGPGETATLARTYTVQGSDWPGPLVNTATATGMPPIGGQVEGQATTSVNLRGLQLFLPSIRQK